MMQQAQPLMLCIKRPSAQLMPHCLPAKLLLAQPTRLL
jgi:hypothetical protein